MKKNGIIWCENWQFPFFYGFCPDAKAWDAEMLKLGLDEPAPYPAELHGSVSYLSAPGTGNEIAIMTINDAPQPAIIKVTLIVHEATHIWQRLCRIIGERKPSREFEAYSMQAISTNLIRAFEQSRGPLMHKGKCK